MGRFLKFSILLSLVSLVSFGYYLWKVNLPLISPLDLISAIPTIKRLSQPQSEKIVLGFLPYWNLKFADSLPLKHLTHVVYFGVDIAASGEFNLYEAEGQLEPGINKMNSNEFSKLHRQLKLSGKKSIILVKAFTQEQISGLVNNPKSTTKAIDNIVNLVIEKQFDGVNIDFEYVGTPDQKTIDNYSKFMYSLNWACKIRSPGCEVSTDTFADASTKNRLWDLNKLKDSVDYIVIMAYDYHRASSTQAGPIAPLRGGCSTGGRVDSTVCLEYDVLGSVADNLKQIPPEKIVLGIPFYGYEWQTAGTDFLANTYEKTGGTATYKRIQDLLSAPDQVSSLSALWSQSTLSPYIVYKEGTSIFQIHYEDARSLGLKLDLVNQTNLRGIGIWALGYELPYTELWDTIEQKL